MTASGPNGSGKSTTMRMLLALDRPDRGAVRIDNRKMTSFAQPMRTVGRPRARQGARAPVSAGRIERAGQEARPHAGLRASGVPDQGERPHWATPANLIFDEPANGLDPEGISWMRDFLRALAAEGRSIFVSSHLLSEMALIADDLVVIGRGRMIFQGAVHEFVTGAARSWVTVRSPQVGAIASALESVGATVTRTPDGGIDVVGPGPVVIGELAAHLGATLHELSPRQGSLEDAFLQVTADAVEYQGHAELPPEAAP